MNLYALKLDSIIREHDLDDLVPLLTLETSDIEARFNRMYLTDLIAMSDRNNQSIVAEV